jgi:hypothetical protein
MCRQLVGSLFSLLILVARPATSQVASPSPTQLQTVQLHALSALMPTARPTSIVLNGTFTSTEGSLNQNGNAQLTVGSDGTFLVSLSRTVGAISESRTFSDGIPTCTWTDPKNVVHDSSFVNCMPPAWFFPGLTLLASNSAVSVPAWTPLSYTSDSLGNHLRFQFVVPTPDGSQKDPQLFSPFDLVLAPDTNLPQHALFMAHPDNPGVHADIPVRISYSDYRQVSGVMIPFRVKRFVNESLTLDLSIASASVQ